MGLHWRALIIVGLLIVGAVGVSEAWAPEGHESAEPPAQSGTMEMTQPNGDHQHGSTGQIGMTTAEEEPVSLPARIVRWLGKLHNAAVHFPIALLMVTGLLEVVAMRTNRPALALANRVLMGLATVSVVGAAAVGWLAMGWSVGSEDAVHETHRFIGTSLIPLSLAAWWAKERHLEQPTQLSGRLYGVLLGSAVALVMVNGFLGGALSHGGLDHLRF